MDTTEGKIRLISDVINSSLNIDVSVLMGANIAMDVAQGDFCESTIGCCSEEQGVMLQSLFNRPSFRVNVVRDVAAVELCGALKASVVYLWSSWEWVWCTWEWHDLTGSGCGCVWSKWVWSVWEWVCSKWVWTFYENGCSFMGVGTCIVWISGYVDRG